MLAAVVTLMDPPPPPSVDLEEPHAFTNVVRTVVAAVLRVPLSHPDVDDGASETMRRALEGRARLRPGEPMRPWLLGIARHVALDMIRKKGRERPMSATVPAGPDSSGDVSLLDRIPDSAPSPLERVEEARRADLLRKAMRDLPEGMREALVLFYVEGLGYDMIAKRMNIPLGTVATWIARGRKTLGERMVSLERSRS